MLLYVVLLQLTVAVLAAPEGNGQKLCKEDLLQRYMFPNLTEPIKSLMTDACETCMVEHEVDYKDLLAVENQEEKLPPRNAMCYFRCYYLKIGTMKPDGDMDFSRLDQIAEPKVNKAIETCVPVMDRADECIDGYRLYDCFLTEVRKT